MQSDMTAEMEPDVYFERRKVKIETDQEVCKNWYHRKSGNRKKSPGPSCSKLGYPGLVQDLNSDLKG